MCVKSMFQSDDDVTFDEGPLSDVFDGHTSYTSWAAAAAPPPCPNTSTRNILALLGARVPEANQQRSLSARVPEKHQQVSLSTSVPEPEDNRQRRVVRRRFPGPAGILPARGQACPNLSHLHPEKPAETQELVCSQRTEAVFTHGPWQRMLGELRQTGRSPTDQYTVSWIKTRAASGQLRRRRAPFLAAAIVRVDHSTRDPMALLQDPTGEIQASLLDEVWQAYGQRLLPGTVLVLRQLGVLTTTRSHYLAVTLNNLVAIYDDLGVTRVAKVMKDELLKSFDQSDVTFDGCQNAENFSKHAFDSCQNAENFSKHTFDSSRNAENFSKHTFDSSRNAENFSKHTFDSCQNAENFSKHTFKDCQNADSSSKTTSGHQKFVFKPNLHAKDHPSPSRDENLSFLDINLDESAILSQVLDGVDVASIFDDF